MAQALAIQPFPAMGWRWSEAELMHVAEIKPSDSIKLMLAWEHVLPLLPLPFLERGDQVQRC